MTKVRVAQSGQTLVDAMLAISLTGLAAVAIMQLSAVAFQANTSVALTQSSIRLYSKLGTLVSSEPTCRLGFGGPSYRNGSTTGNTTTPTFSYSGGAWTTPNTLSLYEPGPPTVILSTVSPTNTFQLWKINSIQLSSVGSVTGTPTVFPFVFPAMLTVQLQSIKDGKPETFSGIYLSVSIDTTHKLTSCSPMTLATDQSYFPSCPSDALPTATDYTRVLCKWYKCPSGAAFSTDGNGDILCNGVFPVSTY